MHFLHIVIIPGIDNPAMGDIENSVDDAMSYFENRKYDWYQIGGRWTGFFDDYDPDTDSANIIICKWCNGTGMRNDLVGQNLRKENPDYKCNSCQGKGEHPVRPTEYKPHLEDCVSVPEYLSIIETNPKDKLPYSILFPDGSWIEEESWDGEKIQENDNYHNDIIVNLQKYIDCLAVVVDYHG